jgi:hypothetical protein
LDSRVSGHSQGAGGSRAGMAMTSHLPLLMLLNNPVDLTFFKSNFQYVRELCVIDIVNRLVDLSTGIARGCSGWFRVGCMILSVRMPMGEKQWGP